MPPASSPPPADRANPFPRLKLALVLLVAGVMIALILLHVPGVNGPWYWWWPWRRLTWVLYAAMLLAAIPFVFAQWLYARGRRIGWAVACLALATLCLELTALALQPPTGLRRLPLIVQNTVITSYYTDAAILSEQENISTWEWLYQYPDIVVLLHVHARYKPPGLMLYYLTLIGLFEDGTLAATVGGLGVALMGAAAPVAAYRMILTFGADRHAPDPTAARDAAFCGASFLALCPALLLFLPQFDQAYVTLTGVLLTLYGLTLFGPARSRTRMAIAFGVVMALVLFMSYIFFIYGFFYIVYWAVFLTDRGPAVARRAFARLILAAATTCALYGLLWVLTGFDPIRTFYNIAEAQTIALIPLERPFPWHMLIDVLDFAMAAGYLGFLLVAFYFLSEGKAALFGRSPKHRLVQVALLQIGVVAGAALLPGETARLWMPMLPLLAAPVGFELARWSARHRAVVYACLWLIVVVLCQNMIFIYLGPELDGPR